MNIFISALANNGKACRPNVISRIVSRENGEIIEKTNPKNPVYISDSYTDIETSEALDVITRMEGVCHENGAAAELGNIIKKLGYTAAAETGTAGISQINNHLNKSGEKKVTKGTISWIACFLKERPFAMVVALQNAKADSAAVKIACEILPLAIDMSLDEPPFED